MKMLSFFNIATHFCILDGHTPTPCDTWEAWQAWMFGAGAGARVRVAQATCVAADREGEASPVWISTVFLGLARRGAYFETMVFGGPHDETTRQYSSWDEALAGHQALVTRHLQAGYGLERESE